MVGYSTIINTGQSANAGPQNFVFTNNPGNGHGVGGTCSGDSGGPAFWIDPATGQHTNIVVAVNSYGIAPNCNGNDYQFRTRAQDVAGGMSPWAIKNPAPAGEVSVSGDRVTKPRRDIAMMFQRLCLHRTQLATACLNAKLIRRSEYSFRQRHAVSDWIRFDVTVGYVFVVDG